MHILINIIFACRRHVLDMGQGLHDVGTIQWKLFLGLLVAWILTFVCVVKGVKSTGKVCCYAKFDNTLKQLECHPLLDAILDLLYELIS